MSKRSKPLPVAKPTLPAKQPASWAQLVELFAGDPLISPLLAKLGKHAGKAPPLTWFAGALHFFTNPHDTITQQIAIIEALADAAGQECRLMY